VSDAEPQLRHDLPGGAHALFTARREGNMSSVRGAKAAQGQLARERLREQIAVDRLARGRQVHGAIVARVLARQDTSASASPKTEDDDQGKPLGEADGQVTPLRRLGVMVLTADCLPVAVAAPGAVAMLHAGWRGLAAGILEQGLRSLRELCGEQELQAVIGPGAGPCCYEVGEEVHLALGGEARRGPIDLAAIAERRLRAAGATEVRSLGVCTICDPRFFSHRREGERAGRQAGVAWLS
jgi:YfiH family protein